tara:strand:+ start:13731 stop:14306 length:576 start_codon:yes stop_codon:yes gene_type:complete
MKKITVLLIALTASIASAQTTFDLDWAVGVNGAAASLTIEQGDTVRWTWTDEQPHTVTSESGSTEAFDSGILTGIGEQFSFTFTQVGTNPYDCEVHSAMTGVITVEEALSVDDKFAMNIAFYPNPVNDKLTVTSLFELESYEIYNVLGKKVAQGQATGNVSEINMSAMPSGIYFVNAKAGELESTFKVIKK